MGNTRVSTVARFVHFSHSAAHSDVNVSAFKTQYKSVRNDDISHDSNGSILEYWTEECRWFKCAGDGFDNNLIEMSTTKMKWQKKILSLFNQALKTVPSLYLTTQSDDSRPAQISVVSEGMH